MSKLSISLVFNRRGRKDKNGKAPVEVYCYVDGQKRYLQTGVMIEPKFWDKTKNRVKKDHPNHEKQNLVLERFVRQLEDYQLDVSLEKGLFTYNDLKSYNPGGSKHDFMSFLLDEIKSDNTVVQGTRGYRLLMVKKLKAAVGDRVPFARVNYELLQIFDQWMAGEDLKVSTRKKLHNQLRKFLQIAVNKGFIKKNPYDVFKVKRPPKTNKQCLWYEDLDKIWKLSYPEQSSEELVRLKFLFSCYTGLRISDNGRLTWDDIRQDNINLVMKKTGQPLLVPVNVISDRAKDILERAKKFYQMEKMVFRNISDPLVNRYLKRIGHDIELPFELTFHLSRHTFCTLVAHNFGSQYKVMEYSGLRKADSAMVYVNLSKMYGR